MLLGHPSVGKANYVCFKLWKETHALWIGMKHSLDLKIDGTLACHLLNTNVTGLNRNSIEANDLKLVHFSAIIRF